MPLLPDRVSGDPIDSPWGDAIRDQTVQTCAAAGRPATPVEGMALAVTDTDRLEVYDGADWRRVAAYTQAGRTGVRVAGVGGDTLNPSSRANLTWSTPASDPDVFWSSGAAQRLTVPAGLDGLYVVTFFAGINDPAWATPSGALMICVNDVPIVEGSIPQGAYPRSTVTWCGPLAAADYVTGSVFQGSVATSQVSLHVAATASVAEGPALELWRLSA